VQRAGGERRAMSLADRDCVPCKGGTPPLTPEQCKPLLAEVPQWQVVDGHHLQRTYRLADFAQALALVNRIGDIAEKQFHHPDIELAWGKVGVKIWTHKIDGLTESDFVFAAKCDRAFAAMGSEE
jgi:4a-hydroxytetrahydrobiopterin dehydratase